MWLRLGIIGLLLALAGRLAAIQIGQSAYYTRLSVAEVRNTVSVPSIRGGIYDRHGAILAISSPASMVVADDFQITEPDAEAAALAPLLSLPVSSVAPQLKKHSGYVVLTNSLSIAAAKEVAQHYFPGIVVLPSAVRTEPNGPIATALLGGINASGAGSAGLEYEFQSMLAGASGIERVFESPSGVNLPSSRVVTVRKAVPGVGLELTVDTALQFVAEQALGEQLRTTRALSGTAIVMDVRTGEILANASLVNTAVPAGILGPIPAWGQSIGVPGVEQTINNLAVSQVYEPGSVFKIVPFSAALNAGLITPSTTFRVPYDVTVGSRVFHDAERHGVETLSAMQILAQSSNIGTYEIASHVGEAGLLAQVERLGFGQMTSLHFPGETPGLLVDSTRWYPSDLAALPIGQVDAVTPLQVLDAYNSIANGGVFVEPKLVRGFIHSDGRVAATAPSASHSVLTPQIAATLNQMLQQVVLEGTGTKAVIPGYQIAGKTGTSQIPTPDRGSYIPGAYNASFVGFAPANHPVLSMIVVVQRPRTVIFGGSVAAPVFQRVMSYALHHYGIPSNGFTPTPPPSSRTLVSSDVT
jgi:cell division protein FtsI (penicillin-binding protein 3)